MIASRSRPVPDPAFRWSREAWGDALRCVALEPIAQHLFTTKQLELRSADRSPEAWAMAAASIGADRSEVARIRQVHGPTVRVVRREQWDGGEREAIPEADAQASDVSGLVLAVQVADCVPLLMADPSTGAAAAVHAGWRGAAARIVERTVDTLAGSFGVDPAHLVVAIGPSIGPCCYEVGEELIDAFRAAAASDADVAAWFVRTNGSLRLDLWRTTRDQLVAAGVPASQVHVAGLCTKTHADIFDSYRTEGPNAGRMAALIRVP